MLDINLIRENPERVRQSLRDRQMDASSVDSLLELDVTAPRLGSRWWRYAERRAQHGLQRDRPNERS